MPCDFDEGLLGKYAEGALREEERAGVEEHLALCEECFQAVTRTARIPDPLSVSAVSSSGRPETSGVAVPSRTWRRPLLAAASVLAAAGVLTWAFQGGYATSESGSPPQVRLEEGSRGYWEPVGRNGGRTFFLEQGEAQAEVTSGAGSFVLETSAGMVKVLGTRFSVRLIPVPPLDGLDLDGQVALVDLWEGRVELANGAGAKRLSGRQRGVLAPGVVPYPVESIDRPVSRPDVMTIFRNMVEAYRRRDARSMRFFLGVLAMQGGDVPEFLADLKEASGDDGVCARWVMDAFKTETGESK